MVEDDEVDAAVQGVGQVDEVLEGAAEAVELADDELVAGAQNEQGLVQLGSAGEFPGGLVDELFDAAGGAQGVLWASGCWSRVDTRP